MDMRDAIIKQNAQLAFEPEIEFAERLGNHDTFIVAGMGGSHLAADILKCWNPLLDIIVHSDYGLPALNPDHTDKRLFIASSYSGNTEEVIDGFTEAISREMPVCAIAVGGELLNRAEQEHIPYIRLPDTGIQPRSALGFSVKALLKVIREENASAELRGLAEILIPESFEHAGKNTAAHLAGRMPLIYASRRNAAVAYIWKIKFNETGKIPAFMNVVPELNHNEMTGFDAIESTAELSAHFYAILLFDEEDHPRIQKRMDILERLYHARGIPVQRVRMEGRGRFEKIFSSLYLADWVAYHTAMHYGADPSNVPIVEEFKKLIAG